MFVYILFFLFFEKMGFSMLLVVIFLEDIFFNELIGEFWVIKEVEYFNIVWLLCVCIME